MREFADPHSRGFGRVVVVLMAALTLPGCSAFNKNPPPPCPPVFILSDAAHVTKFRPGPGRDLTDEVLTGEIVGFTGECGYDAKGAELTLQVKMAVKRGPAARDRGGDLSYFVAIPKFYPASEAKAVFTVPVRFPEGMDSVVVTDDEISLRIPVKDKEIINQYEIFLGFQTSSEELEINRRMKR